MVNTQQAVVVTAAGLAVIALVAAVIVLTSVSLLTSGTIVSSNPDLKIFADQACTKQISTVQWVRCSQVAVQPWHCLLKTLETCL